MDRRLPDRDQSVPQLIDGTHLTEDALEVYSLGRLSSEEDLATLEEHLLVCAYCQTRLEKVDQFVQAAASGARSVAEAQSAKKPLARGITVRAAIPVIQELRTDSVTFDWFSATRAVSLVLPVARSRKTSTSRADNP